MKRKSSVFVLFFVFLFMIPVSAHSQNQSMTPEEIEAFEKAEECRSNVDSDSSMTDAEKIVAREKCDDEANAKMVGTYGVDTKGEEIREDRKREILKCEEWHSQYQTDSLENFMTLKDVKHAEMCILLYKNTIWSYEGEDRIERLVEYSLTPQSKTDPFSEKVSSGSIKVAGSEFMVDYEITNGNVVSVMPDVDSSSLIVGINADDTDDVGILTLDLPRTVVDAKVDNNDDDEFFVLADGEELAFEEITTANQRTLTIVFPADTEEIEIIGTFVIPEFGAIAMLVLAIAIISIITVSSRSRLNTTISKL